MGAFLTPHPGSPAPGTGPGARLQARAKVGFQLPPPGLRGAEGKRVPMRHLGPQICLHPRRTRGKGMVLNSTLPTRGREQVLCTPELPSSQDK